MIKKKIKKKMREEIESGKQNLGKHMLMQHMKNTKPYKTEVANFGVQEIPKPMFAQEHRSYYTVSVFYRELLTHTKLLWPSQENLAVDLPDP